MKTRTLLAAVATTGLVAGAANAAITVDAVSSWIDNTADFDASGSDKLVVVVSGEHGNPGWIGDISGVTYDGVALTQAVNRDAVPGPNPPPGTGSTDQSFNDIWYLDGPITSTGDIVVTASTRWVVTAFALSGTASGVGNTAISGAGSKSVNLTTSADNSLVIAAIALGADGNTGNTTNVDADSPQNEESAIRYNTSNWNGHVTGTATVGTAGAGTYSFSGGSTTGGYNTIAAEFLEVPEPGSLALLGLGGLLIARRRRS